MSTERPQLPWQKVASDMFEWRKNSYLLIVDYYSRWIEIAKQSSQTSECVIEHMSSIFARHGIPEELTSDNGSQYTSEAFAKFACIFGFRHITSSPRFPQANGEAERAVQTIKSLLNKSTNPYLALLEYRATPLQNGFSPSELLMSSRLRTTLPLVRKQRVPKVVDFQVLAEKEQHLKDRQCANLNHRELTPLQPGDGVWITDRETTGQVQEEVGPRSVTVQTPDSVFRRNRRHLVQLSEPVQESVELDHGTSQVEKTIQPTEELVLHRSYRTRSQTGSIPKPPERLDPSWN